MKNKYIGYLALVPFAVVVILYELLPLLQLVYSSLIGKESETFGLENFIKIFTTPLYQQAIINSVKISLISAIVGILYIYFQIPLSTLLLIPAFAGIRPEWRQAAMLLNAGPLDYWFRIAIPNLLPSILGTLSVLFANALAAYASAYALVSNNYALLALQITSKYKGDVEIDRATGGALAVVLILLMVVATLINNYFTKRNTKGRDLV